jgi:hypothetical protein
MASIQNDINQILDADYGEEVRGSIVNALTLMNEESTSANTNSAAAVKSAKESATSAANAVTEAQTAQKNASASASDANTAQTAASNANTAAQEAKTSAAKSAQSAANSETNAKAAATSAEKSNTEAKEAKEAAKESATVAERLNNDLNNNLKFGISVDDLYDSNGDTIQDSNGNNVMGTFIFVNKGDFSEFQNEVNLELTETTKTANEALTIAKKADELSSELKTGLKTGMLLDTLYDSNGDTIQDNRSNEIKTRLIFVDISAFTTFQQQIITEINMMLQDIVRLKNHALLDNNY